MRRCVVLGAGGFIGGHLAKRLKSEGCWVRGVDIKSHDFFEQEQFCDDFILGDLRDLSFVESVIPENVDEIYQLAADMGGAGYIFTGENDSNVMHNSCQINLNVVKVAVSKNAKRVFYSSSACMYPAYNQEDPENPNCKESSAYPAAPDSEYGWEKLFSERLYLAASRNFGLNVRIARYHNIFGPMGTWRGGKEKAPAAICRKVCEAQDGSSIDIWGDGTQTRSFLYIDECIDGTIKLMRSDFSGPVNIGSDQMITVQGLAKMIIEMSNKHLEINNISGPTGVRGRNSNNDLIKEKLEWSPSNPLSFGIRKTFEWIEEQVRFGKN